MHVKFGSISWKSSGSIWLEYIIAIHFTKCSLNELMVIVGCQKLSTLVTGSFYLVGITMRQEVAVPREYSVTVFDLTLYFGVVMDESSVVHQICNIWEFYLARSHFAVVCIIFFAQSKYDKSFDHTFVITYNSTWAILMLMVYHFNFPVSPREVLVFVHIACARNLPPSGDGQLCLRVSGAWVEGELLRAAACWLSYWLSSGCSQLDWIRAQVVSRIKLPTSEIANYSAL